MISNKVSLLSSSEEKLFNNIHFIRSFFSPFMDLSIGIIVVDRESRICFINPMAGYFLGVNPSSASGKSLHTILPHGEKFDEVFKTHSPFYNLESLVNERILKSSYIPITISASVDYVVQLIQDHTEKIRNEKQLIDLKSKYDFLDTLIEHAFEEFGAVDQDGRLTYLTRKSARNLGAVRDEIIGQDINKLSARCLLKKVAFTGEPVLGSISRRGKKKKPVLVTPIIREKHVVGAICKSIFEDIDAARGFINNIREIENAKENKLFSHNVSTCRFTFDDIIGRSKTIIAAKEKAKKVAIGNSTILISGESGTGKEIFSQAIHLASSRRNQRFVVVNCAGMPETLLEAELFGYEPGSFTGAQKGGKPGKFEMAHRGTLFLDEAGDMPISMQAKLLRAIQEKSFERVGGTVTYEADVRIIAASNKDLWTLVKKGQFREDLYYRLDVINLQIPPLRDRLEDIPLLVNHFIPLLKETTNSNVFSVSADLIKLFKSYQWPGNIRELKNVLEGAMNLHTGEVLNIDALPGRIKKKMMPKNSKMRKTGAYENQYGHDMKSIEKNLIKEILAKTSGNKRQASEYLKISRTTLYNKIKKYGL